MEKPLESILTSFRPITLDCMDLVKLMTRSDEKYLFRIDRLPGLLEMARPDFQVLEHSGKRLLGYESMYLDTPDHKMYLMHHNGKLNRFKIRIREYRETHEFYFEIKFKDNHRVTTKNRTRIGPGLDYHSDEIRKFMLRYVPYSPEMLEPVLFSSFERITLVDSKLRERITIDINPTWRFGDKWLNLSQIVILEVKSGNTSSTSGFSHLLREARVTPSRLSKYCIGTAMLYPEIKHNSFKAKLLKINKLNNKIVYGESYHAII